MSKRFVTPRTHSKKIRSLKHVLWFVITFCFTSHCNAAFTNWSRVNYVVAHDHMGLIIIFEDADAAQVQGCTLSNQIVIDQQHYLFDTITSIALSAVHSGAKVRVWVNTCEQYGASTIPAGIRIDISH